MSHIYERMQQLDAWAASVLSQSALIPSISQPHTLDDRTELIAARSIRAIARIKLSRYPPPILWIVPHTDSYY